MGVFSDLAANAIGSAVGAVEHAYLVVFDTGNMRPVKTVEAQKLDAKKPLIEVPDLPVDLTALREQLTVYAQYASAMAAVLADLFPHAAIDDLKKAEKYVGIKRVKVQFNPTQVQVNALGSKLAFVSGATSSNDKKSDKSSYGYSEVPPRITVNIPIIIDEEENTRAFASDTVNVANMSNVGQTLLNAFTGTKCTVKEETEAILSLLRNSSTRTVGFYWGSKMSYVGSIISAQATYTMFHRNGDPCRAKINLQILTVEQSSSAGFKKQWDDKYNAFSKADKTSLSAWGESANLGNVINLPF